ncbi:Gfo/Idh/MocA family protein [Oceanobacillus sp. CFH 90083]|uniref:Gfo/Idh/MocA family protein n=1 Tax=Oceanobacillus sp. CFH 90083 TaxID=2592336 RepID=UPI00128AFE3E|nr:Gfo/Idh/MocA family oxidoreductase [Oceanobacillus sp. CFH 90083]
MKKLKMGLIGAGGIAENRHIPAYQSLSEQVEIVGVHDVNLVRAEEVAEKYAIPHVYANDLDMLKHVDAVTICTPNKFHESIAVAALNHGVHVLCEKPMAMNAEEGKRMLDAAEANHKILMIGYHYRFIDAVMLAKASMPEVGAPIVTRVQALRQRKVPGWGVFINKELQGGGSLIDWGCHLLDAALWLVAPSKPAEVQAQVYQRLSKQPNQINDWGSYDHEAIDVDDHVSAYIRFDDQSTLLFECSWAANIKEDQTHISISGENGGLSVFPFEFYQPKYHRMMETHAKTTEDHQQAGVLQAKNFIDACLGKDTLKSSPKDALLVTKVIDAIYASSEQGKPIVIN